MNSMTDCPSPETRLLALDALLGHVTPNLRRVQVIDENEKIVFRFFYQGKIGEMERQLIEKIITKMKSDPLHHFDWLAEQLDYPQKPPHRGVLLYVRYEPTPPEFLHEDLGPVIEATT